MGLQFLEAFRPDGDGLLRRVSTHIDEATLELIANEDPIGDAARRARLINALRDIRAGGPLKKYSDFASPDEFYDHDVAEILRNSSDMSRGPQGHWVGAFASAVLLRAQGYTSEIFYNYPVVQLVESIRRLNVGLEPEAMALLAWFILRLSDDDYAPGQGIDHDLLVFAGTGILSLAVTSKNTISDDTIIELANWLIAEEKSAAGEQPSPTAFPNHWLFRATAFDLDREKWMAIGEELAAFKATGPCGDAVRGIGQRLSGRMVMRSGADSTIT